jgi:hypothetical protein
MTPPPLYEIQCGILVKTDKKNERIKKREINVTRNCSSKNKKDDVCIDMENEDDSLVETIE